MLDIARSFGTRLQLTGGRLNLAFHDLVETPSESRPYNVRLTDFRAIVDWCIKIDLARHVRLYFDDNHRSFFDRVLPDLEVPRFAGIAVAVPVISIGMPGHGEGDDLDRARTLGVQIVPHGYQHVRLASYAGPKMVLDTPRGGSYQDRHSEKSRPLTDNEVLFQLVEAYERLPADEFVLPYGAYNTTTVGLNARLRLYRYLATADFEVDRGQHLRPRLLVRVDTANPEALTATIAPWLADEA